jgi:predicted PurR-regulated permease PerM
MDEKRLVVALFGFGIATVLGFLAYKFIAALTVSVFLYYSTRRYYSLLGQLRLPARTRAAVVIASLAIPLLLLISYTLLLLVIEARQFVAQYAVLDVVGENVRVIGATSEIPDFTLQGIYGAYQTGELDVVIDFVFENLSFLTGLSQFVLNLLIVVIVTYYLLIDGPRFRRWLLKFDEDALVREYLEAADEELEAVLFGNLLNVIAISLIAVGTFVSYNALVPAAVKVPYPALAGVLTGIASLIPVVGMKIVYLPLSVIAAVPLLLESNLSLLIYILGFLVVAIIVVDTIPDILLRPYLSGETTHVGLLMLAYILGPVVLGFYGLFFAPIVLVLSHTFADTALPRLLGAEPDVDVDMVNERLPDGQRRLNDF